MTYATCQKGQNETFSFKEASVTSLVKSYNIVQNMSQFLPLLTYLASLLGQSCMFITRGDGSRSSEKKITHELKGKITFSQGKQRQSNKDDV